MVYHYTKRAMLARLLANKGLAIYVVHLNRLSQKVTYLFCDELDIVSKELRSRVRQATKDVVKSEV